MSCTCSDSATLSFEIGDATDNLWKIKVNQLNDIENFNRGKYIKFSKRRVLQNQKNCFPHFDWMMI